MGILCQSIAGAPPDTILSNDVRVLLVENMAYKEIDTGDPLAIVRRA